MSLPQPSIPSRFAPWLVLLVAVVFGPSQTEASFVGSPQKLAPVIPWLNPTQAIDVPAFTLENSHGLFCGNDPVNRHDPLGLAIWEGESIFDLTSKYNIIYSAPQKIGQINAQIMGLVSAFGDSSDGRFPSNGLTEMEARKINATIRGRQTEGRDVLEGVANAQQDIIDFDAHDTDGNGIIDGGEADDGAIHDATFDILNDLFLANGTLKLTSAAGSIAATRTSTFMQGLVNSSFARVIRNPAFRSRAIYRGFSAAHLERLASTKVKFTLSPVPTGEAGTIKMFPFYPGIDRAMGHEMAHALQYLKNPRLGSPATMSVREIFYAEKEANFVGFNKVRLWDTGMAAFGAFAQKYPRFTLGVTLGVIGYEYRDAIK